MGYVNIRVGLVETSRTSGDLGNLFTCSKVDFDDFDDLGEFGSYVGMGFVLGLVRRVKRGVT